MTLTYAAKVYLAVATRSNKLRDNAWDKLPAQPTLAQWRAFFKADAAISRDFADRLKARIWPVEAAADMKLLLRKEAETALVELTLSKEIDVDEFNRRYDTWDRLALQTSGLANAVRQDLGLEPVPVE